MWCVVWRWVGFVGCLGVVVVGRWAWGGWLGVWWRRVGRRRGCWVGWGWWAGCGGGVGGVCVSVCGGVGFWLGLVLAALAWAGAARGWGPVVAGGAGGGWGCGGGGPWCWGSGRVGACRGGAGWCVGL